METRTCKKCGETKPLERFVKDSRVPSGYDNRCKACKYAGANPTSHAPEIRSKYKGRYSYDRRKYQATVNRGVALWFAAHPGAKAAHAAVSRAVRKGVLPPIASQDCCHCSAPAVDYHHHLGYQKAHWLDVIPLCRSCHKAAEKIS